MSMLYFDLMQTHFMNCSQNNKSQHIIVALELVNQFYFSYWLSSLNSILPLLLIQLKQIRTLWELKTKQN